MQNVLAAIAVIVALIFGILAFGQGRGDNSLAYQQQKIDTLRSLRSKAIEFKRWSQDEMGPVLKSVDGSKDIEKINMVYSEIIPEQRQRYLTLVDEYYSARGYFSKEGRQVVDDAIEKEAAIVKQAAVNLEKLNQYKDDLYSREAQKILLELARMTGDVMQYREDFSVTLAEICQAELDLAYSEVEKLAWAQSGEKFAGVREKFLHVVSANVHREESIPAQFSLEPQFRYVPMSVIFGGASSPAKTSSFEPIGDELAALSEADFRVLAAAF